MAQGPGPFLICVSALDSRLLWDTKSAAHPYTPPLLFLSPRRAVSRPLVIFRLLPRVRRLSSSEWASGWDVSL